MVSSMVPSKAAIRQVSVGRDGSGQQARRHSIDACVSVRNLVSSISSDKVSRILATGFGLHATASHATGYAHYSNDSQYGLIERFALAATWSDRVRSPSYGRTSSPGLYRLDRRRFLGRAFFSA